MNTGTRRYSMVNYGQHYNPNKMNTPGNLFQTLGTGVVRILIIYEFQRFKLVMHVDAIRRADLRRRRRRLNLCEF